MRFYLKLSLFFLVASCGYDVENQEPPCDPQPVAFEISWRMNITSQEASLTVKPGDTVRWIWGENNMPHDITSEDPNAPDDFGSPLMTGLGMVYQYVFEEETVFEYFCSVHPTTMKGTIIVEPCE